MLFHETNLQGNKTRYQKLVHVYRNPYIHEITSIHTKFPHIWPWFSWWCLCSSKCPVSITYIFKYWNNSLPPQFQETPVLCELSFFFFFTWGPVILCVIICISFCIQKKKIMPLITIMRRMSNLKSAYYLQRLQKLLNFSSFHRTIPKPDMLVRGFIEGCVMALDRGPRQKRNREIYHD